MGVAEELDDLRGAFEACRIAAFADIDAQLVLVSSSAKKARRETLDKLCAEAAGIFRDSKVPSPVVVDFAVSQQDGELKVFLCEPEQRLDAACFVCEPGLDLDAFLTAARSMLDRLTQSSGDGA